MRKVFFVMALGAAPLLAEAVFIPPFSAIATPFGSAGAAGVPSYHGVTGLKLFGQATQSLDCTITDLNCGGSTRLAWTGEGVGMFERDYVEASVHFTVSSSFTGPAPQLVSHQWEFLFFIDIALPGQAGVRLNTPAHFATGDGLVEFTTFITGVPAGAQLNLWGVSIDWRSSLGGLAGSNLLAFGIDVPNLSVDINPVGGGAPGDSDVPEPSTEGLAAASLILMSIYVFVHGAIAKR